MSTTASLFRKTSLPGARPIWRSQLASTPSNGHTTFIPQCRKLVFECCPTWPSSAKTRTFLTKRLFTVARAHPHVEFVVKQRFKREPIVRGFYLNGREKVVPLQKLEVTGVEGKVQLLLDSSGAKIRPLKRRFVESTAESARGIWSALHDTQFKI